MTSIRINEREFYQLLVDLDKRKELTKPKIKQLIAEKLNMTLINLPETVNYSIENSLKKYGALKV